MMKICNIIYNLIKLIYNLIKYLLIYVCGLIGSLFFVICFLFVFLLCYLKKPFIGNDDCQFKTKELESTISNKNDFKDYTRKKKNCKILSFDGGGSRGVIEVVILKKVFDYLAILQQRPETTNWIIFSGNTDEETIIEKFGNDKVDRVISVKNISSKRSNKHKSDNSFIVSLKTFKDKLEILKEKTVMEGKTTDIEIKDFSNLWINYWFIINKDNRDEIENRVSSLNKKLLKSLRVKNVQIADFSTNELLVMINFNIDSSIKNRTDFLQEIMKPETPDKLPTRKFITPIHPNDIFDIIVGTSTGSLISFALIGVNCGNGQFRAVSLEECVEVYKENAKVIFSRSWFHNALRYINKHISLVIVALWPYPKKNVQKVLDKMFGKETKLSDLPSNKCIAAAVSRKINGKWWGNELVVFDTVSEKHKNKSVVSVLLASSNAPIYFKTPVIIDDDAYVDGGVGGDCPLQEVIPFVFSLFEDVEFALSVAPPTTQKPETMPDNLLEWISYFINIVTDGNLDYRSFKNSDRSDANYSRLSPNNYKVSSPIFKQFDKFGMDSTNVCEMIDVTDKWINSANPLAFSLLSLPMLKPILSNTSSAIIDTYKWLGQYLLLNMNKFSLPDVIQYYKQLLFQFKKIYGESHTDIADCHYVIATCLSNEANQDILYNQYHALKQKIEEEKFYEEYLHPDVPSSQKNIASSIMSDAKNHYQEALIIWEKLSRDHPPVRIAICYYKIADYFKSQKTYLEAQENYENALKLLKILCGDHPHPGIALCLYNIAGCFKYREMSSKAHEYYEYALEMMKKIEGADNPNRMIETV